MTDLERKLGSNASILFLQGPTSNNRLNVNFIQNVGLQSLHFWIKCSLTYLYFLFIYFFFFGFTKRYKIYSK